MNTNPWTDEKAFDPMYTEGISITGQRPNQTLKQTLTCCIFADGIGDPLFDGNVETDRNDIMIVCRKSDWKFVQSLQSGDEITRFPMNMKYVISEVKKDAYWGWIITARGA